MNGAESPGLAGVDAREVWAGHRKGRPGMARALGSPDLGTEMEKQEGWVGTVLGPGHFCFLSSVRLSWPWSYGS